MANTVFDSSAVLALLFDEPAAEQVEQLLSQAVDQNKEVYISAVNWTEVLYRVQQIQGETGVKAAKQFEHETTLAVVDVNRELAELAAELKATYHLSLGDAYCAALAKQMKAVLVTGDREFKQMERQVEIKWIK
ncbi:MAG TPA: type II toxin-antitoxin system VapC family toxin [Candidatus Acidoferrales bacterium]|nr:type II toxin-antitoxin system VapC family toxin [Candidatus Acidoferrales bacterium]